jgi:hypothetical protein
MRQVDVDIVALAIVALLISIFCSIFSIAMKTANSRDQGGEIGDMRTWRPDRSGRHVLSACLPGLGLCCTFAVSRPYRARSIVLRLTFTRLAARLKSLAEALGARRPRGPNVRLRGRGDGSTQVDVRRAAPWVGTSVAPQGGLRLHPNCILGGVTYNTDGVASINR